MSNPNQEIQALSKSQNQDLKDMDVLCTFKIKIEGQLSELGFSNTIDHIQTMIQMPTPQSGTSNVLQRPI